MHAQRAQAEAVDARIAAIAARQFGAISLAQLVALGLGRGAIAHRVAIGRLIRLHTGVYAVGHAAPRSEMRWMAAVLSGGPGAQLSHRSAAALWGLGSREGHLTEITVASRSGRRRADVAIHRSQLAAQDRSTHRGIPVTSPARTLVDLASILDEDALVRAVRELQFIGRFDLDAIQEVLTRRSHRVLSQMIEDLVFAETGLEDRFLAVCARSGLPQPEVQHHLDGKRVDFVWPDERLAVETDGWQAHGTRSAFQADRAVSNRLQLAGYIILRFTEADLRRRPDVVVMQVSAALGARRGARFA